MTPEEWTAGRDAENARMRGAKFVLTVTSEDGKERAYGFIGTGDGKKDDMRMHALGLVGLQCVRYDWSDEEAQQKVPGHDQA